LPIGLDGNVGGFADYWLDNQRIVFTHTEVDDAYRGRGWPGSSRARCSTPPGSAPDGHAAV
jgi:hypothetical protein